MKHFNKNIDIGSNQNLSSFSLQEMKQPESPQCETFYRTTQSLSVSQWHKKGGGVTVLDEKNHKR